MKALELAEAYADAASTHRMESLYGTSKSYTLEKAKERDEAHAVLEAELLRLAAVDAELERIKPAWEEWQKKTEWVQKTCQPKELGLHRADVLKMRIGNLQAELERVTNCLKKANEQAEDFERRWYLANDELERIRALPPVAWYAPALDGWSVSYFDGKPVIMVGRVGNAIHTRPLYALTKEPT